MTTSERPRLLLAALALAGPGLALAIPTAPASAGTTISAVREAEALQISAGAGQVYVDSRASAGRAVLLWSYGSLSGSANAPAGAASTRFAFRVAGDQCGGAPEVDVNVDGQLLGHRVVANTTWVTYAYTGNWRPGPHTVSVSYTNDFTPSPCDRNIRLDRFVFTAPAGTTPPPPPPPATTRTFGLSSDGPGRGISTAISTMAALGHKLDTYNTYEDWGWQGPLPLADVKTIAATGAIPEITWEAWHPAGSVNQADYTNASIVNGNHDAYISNWARDAAAYGQPLMIRFGHEMNGDWYPWAASVNGNSPAQYVAAFRHVHDLFAAAGARNVKWVWSPNVQDGMPTALSSVWPGASYVDAIGVDGYNGGTDVSYMGGWKSPQQLFGSTLSTLSMLAPGVPVFLNEVGSAEGGGSKPAWIGDLFSYLRTTQVTGVMWFDEHGSPGDWALRSSTASMDAARSTLITW